MTISLETSIIIIIYIAHLNRNAIPEVGTKSVFRWFFHCMVWNGLTWNGMAYWHTQVTCMPWHGQIDDFKYLHVSVKLQQFHLKIFKAKTIEQSSSTCFSPRHFNEKFSLLHSPCVPNKLGKLYVCFFFSYFSPFPVLKNHFLQSVCVHLRKWFSFATIAHNFHPN